MRITTPVRTPVSDIIARAWLGAVPSPAGPAGPRDAPAGTVYYFTGETVPSGFLLADGSEVSKEVYASLYSAIGDTYGVATAGNFRLPNYGGYFLRFSDFGSGADPDNATRTDRGDGTIGSAVGTKQESENKSHTHSISSGELLSSGSHPIKATQSATQVGSDAYGGVENRPININLMVVIKW